MLYRRLPALLVLVLAAGLCAPLFGQDKDKDKGNKDKNDKGKGDKVTLKWKFEKDKPFYQTMTTDTNQTMKVMGNNVSQKQNQTFYFKWTPKKQDGDNWTIEQQIIGVKMEIDIGGSKIGYDSTNPAAAGTNPLADFFKALKDSTFTITLNTKEMKVTKVEGREAFVTKLVAANQQMKPLLESILSENALIEMAAPTFAAVPDKAVASGDKWTRKSTLDMGPIGQYENTYTYTFEGKDPQDAKTDKIKVDTALKYKAPSGKEGAGGLPFKIKDAKLEPTTATGTVFFDPAKGRVTRSTSQLDLTGTLTIEIGGQETKVDLSQTQKTTVETSDENPVEKKK